MNKTRRVEAPFVPAGDDNGRRYEPPPRDRTYVSALPRPSCRAAGGLRQPPESRAFPASRSTIYLDNVCSPSEPTDLRERNLPNATSYDLLRKIRRPWLQPPESEDWGRPPHVGEDGFLPYRQFWP
ncbi:hypothetical protein THAOC_20740 [Thalassiosira oceanica]|uniref:Uncharacterized protein n=1 Tax=Thalassiosira oceanica TaxID=159749 RepID=K0SKV8_THAOC|nr:hypothetical protein THAOC_20740 [Thalassiosira oceanica]|eukprot:EJK59082.1 hypothetical protein THAOC_20740 [Thalassiosira oceanica]